MTTPIRAAACAGLLFSASLAGLLPAAGTAVSASPDDADTIALWLFDELPYPFATLSDGSVQARADLNLMEGGTLEPGKYGRALAPSGGDGFRVGYSGYAGKVTEERLREKDGLPSGVWGPTEGPVALHQALAGGSWTIEFWLKFRRIPTAETSLIDLGQGFEPGFFLGLKEGGFAVENAYGGQSVRLASVPAGLDDNRWHHHALVFSGAEATHFIDGRRHASASAVAGARQALPDPEAPKDRVLEDRGFKSLNAEQRRGRRFNLALGQDRRGGRGLDAELDELRISRVARYAASFDPPASFSRSLAVPDARASGPAPLFAGPPDAPLAFGLRKHVFVDDALLEKVAGLALTMNRPFGKTRIDVVPERSAWRPAVFESGGKVFMLITDSYGSKTGNTHLGTSSDGLHFEIERNILTGTPIYAEAFRDANPAAAPEHAFKMTGFVANRGVMLYTSPDGRHWRRSDTTMLPIRSGGSAETYYDDQRGKYVAILRRDSSYDGEGDSRGPGHGRRCVAFESKNIFGAWPFARLQNPYFEGWPFPALTNEGRNVFMPNSLGQVYRTRAIKYPWAPDTYLCFVWRFPPDTQARQVELGTSRDGIAWRYWGPWYIDKGDRAEALSLYGLIRRGDEIWQYSDHGDAHGGSSPRDYYRWTQRLDGFVSLDAGPVAGVAITRPLLLAGDRIEVNAKVAGALRVAVLDPAGRELEGYGLDDCVPFTGDAIGRAIAWRSGRILGPLQGQRLRLKFELRDGKLYAFQTAAAGAAKPMEAQTR